MKTKNELIKMLQNGEIKEFNQYRKDNPNEVIDLSYANLSCANLSFANLSFANLSCANLSCANLSFANLRNANLSFADLRNADLDFADLRNADLDFASLHLSCKSLRFKSDKKQRIQIAFHFASLIANCDNATDEEKSIYENILSYVNKFHRPDVEKLTEINQTK